jgi:hypothetical protein
MGSARDRAERHRLVRVNPQPDRRAGTKALPVDLPALWQAWWRALGVRGPLSGDVNQAIDTSLVHAIGDQLGFININTTRAGDAQLERTITEQVASYGRQLGWLTDALDVLIRTARPPDLDPDDAAALDEVTALRAKVERAKEEAARARVDSVVADIRSLRQDPERNHDALERLRSALDGD